jgi:xylono-1,5-lactonase
MVLALAWTVASVDGYMTQLNINNSDVADIRVVTVSDLHCRLGEGLHWDSVRNSLWGVDIHSCSIWCWELDSPSVKQWQLDQRVGWVIPIQGSVNYVLLGLQAGVACADITSMTVQHWLKRPFEGMPSLRLNDAKADSTGAVWCGSLNNDDESKPIGCLFRLDTNTEWKTIDSKYTVANGPAINATGSVLMHTDSGRRAIFRFDLDLDLGEVSNKQVWRVFTESEGYPDGMCFDAEGALWVAHWGAGCVSRFALDGRLLARITLPTSHITNICFAGPQLDRLFVSSAREGLTSQQLSAQPDAGCVFEVLGHRVKGLPSLPASPSFLSTLGR